MAALWLLAAFGLWPTESVGPMAQWRCLLWARRTECRSLGTGRGGASYAGVAMQREMYVKTFTKTYVNAFNYEKQRNV